MKTRTWFLLSVACFILAGYFWHLGNERYRRDMAPGATNREPAAAAIKELGAYNFRHSEPLSPSPLNGERAGVRGKTNLARSNPLLTNRLSNTSKTIKELTHSDGA